MEKILVSVVGFALVMLHGAAGAVDGCCAPEQPEPSIRVALFADAASTDERSREAAYKVLNLTSGISVDKVTTNVVLSDQLNAYDVLIFPGGTANGEARAIGVEGGRRVEEFVRGGKGFIGICAGGYMMVQGWNAQTSAVQLLNAYCFDDEHWARGVAQVSLAMPEPHEKFGEGKTIHYENGPIFAPANIEGLPPYVSLAKFATDMAAEGAPKGMMVGRDAAIAGRFGKGRAVAFSPHPEQSPAFVPLFINAVRWAAAQGDAPAISILKAE